MIKNILFVGIGGFVGSVGRYLLGKLNITFDVFSLPVGTLLANILGSYIIGFLTGLADKTLIMTPELRLLLMVGFCGGFTTFSSFTNENLAFIHSGQYGLVFVYTALSLLLGFTAVFLGFTSANLL